ncbi:motility associated factor glycosyltransferase family protein [Helicobacter sp. MIT 14-3879]|uniref:motility associated factor glycosyltransferase family protein n=1 Tax=Helicobacter sp. MIT 14-3879 TaxID=2040649 RepID=UPI000E1F7A7D|nr:motility associated factor glycosyltransferase family protein [Helicobacter sp. MIT 14-3879]RDU61609.1 motility accessory factor [Helicobacter sp. MIT 14-3879]
MAKTFHSTNNNPPSDNTQDSLHDTTSSPQETTIYNTQAQIHENSIYERNLESLSYRDPLLFYNLLKIGTNTQYEVFMGSDSANFNIVEIARNIPLYQGDPLQENLAVLKRYEAYRYYPYLYAYGLGNGILYRMMLGNEILKRMVVVEPELEIIYIVLNLIDFSEEILSNRLIILHAPQCNFNMINSLFDMDKFSKVYSKVYDLLIPNHYYEKYHDEILRINKDFVMAIEHNVISVGNDTRDAIIGIKQHIENMKYSLYAPSLIEIHSKLKGRDTAIIISTGPSLYKQLKQLKEIAPYATLFCIDASFPILYQHGIKPDIVFSLERVKESARFYTDTPIDAQEGVIFSLTSIVHEDTIHAIKKGVKQFSFRPFGYTTLFNFYEYGYLGIGMSAANMAYELVVHSQFKRCIIIGQDLVFGEDGTSHSKGAVYGENEIKPKKDKIFVEKYGGGGVVESTEVWKLFLNFYEKDIANTPYPIEVINATEGGARIKGTIEMPFNEACKLIPRVKKKPIILKPPSKATSKKNREKAIEICQNWIDYGELQQEKIEKVFLELIAFLKEIEELNKQNRLNEFNYATMEKLIDSIDEIKEVFNSRVFHDYFTDALQSYIFHQELDIAQLLVRPIKNDEDKRAKELEWLYHHRYWLFSLAGGIDTVVVVVRRALEYLTGEKYESLKDKEKAMQQDSKNH